MAIFSPLLLLLGFVGLVIIGMALNDRTVELRRGNPWHEWLLGEPLSELPPDLIPAVEDMRYFWSSGEFETNKNHVEIRTPLWDPTQVDVLVKWLESRGFTVRQRDASSATLKDEKGYLACVSLHRVSTGAEIYVSVTTHPAEWDGMPGG